MTPLADLLLAARTYAFRVCGPVLHRRVEVSCGARRVLSVSATVLLGALVATSALTDGHGFAGWSRPAGVLVGGVLAARGRRSWRPWRRPWPPRQCSGCWA